MWGQYNEGCLLLIMYIYRNKVKERIKLHKKINTNKENLSITK